MKRKHLFWLLLPTYWALIAVAIIVVALYAFHSMSNLYFRARETDIRTRAMLLSEAAFPLVQTNDLAAIDTLCKKLGRSTSSRFTIIMPDGTVTGDSEENPDSMDYHGGRPEIRQALEGGVGVNHRFSRSAMKEMLYVAVPMKNTDGKIICVVRASLPMTTINAQLNQMTFRVVMAALLTGLLAMGVCIIVVRRITSPLLDMSQAARRFAGGDFSNRIPAQQTIELDQLAESLNTMSEQLNETLTTFNAQRNEQQAVLSSMDEGVLAIDRRERIIHMNRVAGEILRVDPSNVKRDMIQQVIRHSNLLEFIKAALGSQKPVSVDMVLTGETERQVQAHGTVLRNSNGESIGALIILRDVTQLRHLERVRSDFVANVSHELKTPITSIKGFVETLLSDEWHHSPEILRFLEIINQQSSRLNAIIDDLLTLSRLEQKEGRVQKESCQLAGVIHNAIYLCQLQAAKKNITVSLECPEELSLSADAHLLEQALVNLIINAIKYSEPEKKVTVSADEKDGRIAIRVKDQGFGIEHKHLERLFERFYRVDTARSRKLGGTGLGLSIVRHIVQAHGGTIRVESKVGVGSTFTILIPAAGAEAAPRPAAGLV